MSVSIVIALFMPSVRSFRLAVAGLESGYVDDRALTSLGSAAEVVELKDAFDAMIRGEESMVPLRAVPDKETVGRFRRLLADSLPPERLMLFKDNDNRNLY